MPIYAVALMVILHLGCSLCDLQEEYRFVSQFVCPGGCPIPSWYQDQRFFFFFFFVARRGRGDSHIGFSYQLPWRLGLHVLFFAALILKKYCHLEDDDICDCPGTCADEEQWDCSTCGCPDECGGSGAPCKRMYFRCSGSNCTIPLFYVNDNQCHCPDCSDEEFWTCETCTFGCPAKCGGSYACDLRVFQCASSDCELAGFQVTW